MPEAIAQVLDTYRTEAHRLAAATAVKAVGKALPASWSQTG
ncbi:hypothetical protein [Nonomuraea aurantiaca]|nr:hypothetical protein [Nonomuraea aurantiaca]